MINARVTDKIELVDNKVVKNHISIVEKLAGKYKNRVQKIEDLEEAKQIAMIEAIKFKKC